MPEETDLISAKMGFALQAIYAGLPEGILGEFAKLETDVERAKFVWKLPAVQDALCVETEFSGKSEEKAQKYRDEGNTYFRKKSYLSATHSYTLSIVHAPTMMTAKTSEQTTPINGHSSVGATESATSNGTPHDDATVGLTANGVSASGSKESNGESGSTENVKAVNNITLALAYANRSASLLHMRRYKLCLIDIDHAFANDYPADMAYKLHERRATCLAAMGQRDDALESLQTAREALLASGGSEKVIKLWNCKLDKAMHACVNAKTAEQCVDDKHSTIPELSDEPNNVYQNASVAVDVVRDEATTQRHMLAARNIKTGDVLIVEKPYTAVLLTEFYSTHCYACLRRVMAPVPCNCCSTVVFCSDTCRDLAWSRYHRYECRYMAVLDTSWCGRIAHLAVRIVIQEGVEPLIAAWRRDNPEFDENGRYLAEDYRTVRHLVTNAKSRAAEGLFDFAVVTTLLRKLLIAIGLVSDEPELESAALIGGALMHHLQVIQCNAIPVTELQLPTHFDDPKPKDVGIALYPTLALINHSCDPNALVVSYGDTSILRAARNIEQGEVVTRSYGPVFSTVTANSRRAQLLGQYSFNCQCEACRARWPLWQDIPPSDPPIFCCAACKRRINVEATQATTTCRHCKATQNISECVELLRASHTQYAEAMETLANTGDVTAALPALIDHLALQRKFIRQPWRDLISCQEAIKQCYRLLGNIRH